MVRLLLSWLSWRARTTTAADGAVPFCQIDTAANPIPLLQLSHPPLDNPVAERVAGKKNIMRAIGLAVCVLLISACGGGGDGGGDTTVPAITLQPVTATVTSVAGVSTGFSVVAIATGQLANTPSVKITDPNGVLQSTATITPR